MFKFILFGIGFMLLFEGLLYFFFTKKMKEMMKLVDEFDKEKIKSFATIICIIGIFIIYCTFKFFKFN